MNSKPSHYIRTILVVAAFGLAAVAQAQIGEVVVPDANRSCDKAVEEMAAALRSRPESLLEEVTKRVGAAPWCACVLTKTAIQTVSASREIVGEIVYAATMAAPEQYKAIATCALEVAPDAAEEIRQALLKAFGETSNERAPGTGKGKSVAVMDIRLEEPVITRSKPAWPGGFIGNIFVIPPAGFAVVTTSEPDDEDPDDKDPDDKGPDDKDPPNVEPPKGTDSDPGKATIRVR